MSKSDCQLLPAAAARGDAVTVDGLEVLVMAEACELESELADPVDEAALRTGGAG